MRHIQKIVDDHERLTKLLESEKKKLEIKGNELAKRQVHNGTERMKLSQDLEQVKHLLSVSRFFLRYKSMC